MATKAKGTKFKIGTEAYTVYKITPPQFERGEVDTTTLDDDYKRRDPGEVIDVKEISMELVYSDTMDGTLKTKVEADASEAMSVVYANGKGWTGNGFVKSFGTPEIAEGGKLVTNVVVACDGEWTQITGS